MILLPRVVAFLATVLGHVFAKPIETYRHSPSQAAMASRQFESWKHYIDGWLAETHKPKIKTLEKRVTDGKHYLETLHKWIACGNTTWEHYLETLPTWKHYLETLHGPRVHDTTPST